MPPRPRRARLALHDLTADELDRAARVLNRAYGDLGTLRARYVDADDEIRRDEDAIGLVLVACRDARVLRQREEREREYLQQVHESETEALGLAVGPLARCKVCGAGPQTPTADGEARAFRTPALCDPCAVIRDEQP